MRPTPAEGGPTQATEASAPALHLLGARTPLPPSAWINEATPGGGLSTQLGRRRRLRVNLSSEGHRLTQQGSIDDSSGEQPPGGGKERWRRRDALVVALLLALGFSWTRLFVARHPERVFNLQFVDAEPGINLSVADALLRGRWLYRDVASPYGPLPALAHAALARLAGNTTSTYVLYLQTTSVASLALAYLLLRRQVAVGPASLLTVFGLAPLMLVPIGMGTGMENGYTTLERCVFLLVLLAWSPLPHRTLTQSCLLGGLLGLCQWIKFGGAVYLGLPIAVLDAITWLAAPAGRRQRTRWLLLLLATVGTAVAVEAFRDAMALSLLPQPIAWEVVWPAYTQRHYQLAGSRLGPRHPIWIGWRVFLFQQLNVLAGLILGICGLTAAAARLGRDVARRGDLRPALEPFRLLLPLLSSFLGVIFFFAHAFSYTRYYWMVVISAGPVLGGLSWRRRLLGLLPLVPAWMLTTKLALGPAAPEVRRFALPDGDRLYLTARESANLRALLSVIRNGGRTAGADVQVVLLTDLYRLEEVFEPTVCRSITARVREVVPIPYFGRVFLLDEGSQVCVRRTGESPRPSGRDAPEPGQRHSTRHIAVK